MPSPKKKVTLYFSSGMLDETQREAIRQDRSISWIIQAAWRIARDEVQRLPGYGAGTDGRGAVGDDGLGQQETERIAVGRRCGRLVREPDAVVHHAVDRPAVEGAVGGAAATMTPAGRRR